MQRVTGMPHDAAKILHFMGQLRGAFLYCTRITSRSRAGGGHAGHCVRHTMDKRAELGGGLADLIACASGGLPQIDERIALAANFPQQLLNA